MSGEDAWVFDSLVCFLHGPVWNAPLQTFIEEKSLVFDPNLQPDDSNPEVLRIHNEYKQLVDFMLGSFMEEMHITPEQFEFACMEGRSQQADNPFHFHQGLFQQIWAANDIKMFIRMMAQRNVELQLQALDLIEKNQLTLLQEGEISENDIKTLTVGQKSASIEEDIAKSLERDLNSPEATRTAEQEATDVADKFERLNLFFEKNDKVDPDDVVSRQEYLRQQRDKIIEIKKKTRAKQLQDTVILKQKVQTSGRPNSAQVAQKLLESGVNTEELVRQSSVEKETNSAMELRKTLAKRLRSEVVEHN